MIKDDSGPTSSVGRGGKLNGKSHNFIIFEVFTA